MQKIRKNEWADPHHDHRAGECSTLTVGQCTVLDCCFLSRAFAGAFPRGRSAVRRHTATLSLDRAGVRDVLSGVWQSKGAYKAAQPRGVSSGATDLRGSLSKPTSVQSRDEVLHAVRWLVWHAAPASPAWVAHNWICVCRGRCRCLHVSVRAMSQWCSKTSVQLQPKAKGRHRQVGKVKNRDRSCRLARRGKEACARTTTYG